MGRRYLAVDTGGEISGIDHELPLPRTRFRGRDTDQPEWGQHPHSLFIRTVGGEYVPAAIRSTTHALSPEGRAYCRTIARQEPTTPDPAQVDCPACLSSPEYGASLGAGVRRWASAVPLTVGQTVERDGEALQVLSVTRRAIQSWSSPKEEDRKPYDGGTSHYEIIARVVP